MTSTGTRTATSSRTTSRRSCPPSTFVDTLDTPRAPPPPASRPGASPDHRQNRRPRQPLVEARAPVMTRLGCDVMPAMIRSIISNTNFHPCPAAGSSPDLPQPPPYRPRARASGLALWPFSRAAQPPRSRLGVRRGRTGRRKRPWQARRIVSLCRNSFPPREPLGPVRERQAHGVRGAKCRRR